MPVAGRQTDRPTDKQTHTHAHTHTHQVLAQKEASLRMVTGFMNRRIMMMSQQVRVCVPIYVFSCVCVCVNGAQVDR